MDVQPQREVIELALKYFKEEYPQTGAPDAHEYEETYAINAADTILCDERLGRDVGDYWLVTLPLVVTPNPQHLQQEEDDRPYMAEIYLTIYREDDGKLYVAGGKEE